MIGPENATEFIGTAAEIFDYFIAVLFWWLD
jgi:hypothetical protein